MKILVTGGAGFIGSHIVDAYVNAGHDVVIIDNLSTGREKFINPKAEFIKCDIRDTTVRDIFAQDQFDVVNHHAAQMDVRLSVKDPIYDAETNVIGLLNVFQNAVEHEVKKIIYASSGGVVYGEQDYFPADEAHPKRPDCPYGVTKLAGENYLYYYAKTFGVTYSAFRYANVYGPRQNPHGEAGVIAIFLEKLFKDEQPIIHGDGEQTRDFIYVGDVVRANVAALTQGDTQVFNIGTGIESNVNEIYQHLVELTGVHKEEKHGPGKPGEQRRSVLAIDKAREELGWQPSLDLRSGLAETVEFFQSHELEAGS